MAQVATEAAAKENKVGGNFGARLDILIDGKWRPSRSEQDQNVYDPGSGAVLARVPFALKEEVDEAVQSAQASFEKWSLLPIPERAKYLFSIKRVLEEHAEELATINTRNHGKILEESRGEVNRMVDNVDSAIAVAYSLSKGETFDQISDGIDEYSVKEPLGVFSIICPFNFPLMVPFWFIPYALVLGDTLVLKPSELDPVPTVSAIQLIQREAKLPPGVLNLVHGSKDVSEALITHHDVKGVTFVGSSPVARRVYKLAGEYGKRAIANGGAKNTIVVMSDASPDKAVSPIVSSFFGNTGQRCLAGANLIPVGEETHSKIVEKFSSAASKLRVGYGLDPSTEMGPVVSKAAKERILNYVEKGLAEDAKMVTDGRKVKVEDEYSNGFYLGATVFDLVSPDMTIAKEEIFGPVGSVIPVDSLEQAIELINRGTNFGNTSSIFTSSGSAARKFKRGVNAGSIGINLGVAQPAAYFPFGGRRESFFGVLHPQTDTVDFFTDKKIVISRW